MGIQTRWTDVEKQIINNNHHALLGARTVRERYTWLCEQHKLAILGLAQLNPL
ncbi:hypothetical protein [Scytonema sp. NUACC26]|uniref:hypothetical protein n=1 Tax=Scytonema sp. NUACC26 TaxID=3140176 RepID=UPI0034DCAEDA